MATGFLTGLTAPKYEKPRALKDNLSLQLTDVKEKETFTKEDSMQAIEEYLNENYPDLSEKDRALKRNLLLKELEKQNDTLDETEVEASAAEKLAFKAANKSVKVAKSGADLAINKIKPKAESASIKDLPKQTSSGPKEDTASKKGFLDTIDYSELEQGLKAERYKTDEQLSEKESSKSTSVKTDKPIKEESILNTETKLEDTVDTKTVNLSAQWEKDLEEIPSKTKTKDDDIKPFSLDLDTNIDMWKKEESQ